MNIIYKKYYIVYKYSIVLFCFMKNDFFILKQQIHEIIKSVEFERNYSGTRAYIEMKLQQLLNQYVCEGEIIDYTVVCDERNNPPSVVENNDLVANIDWIDIFKQEHKYKVSFQNIIKDRYED